MHGLLKTRLMNRRFWAYRRSVGKACVSHRSLCTSRSVQRENLRQSAALMRSDEGPSDRSLRSMRERWSLALRHGRAETEHGPLARALCEAAGSASRGCGPKVTRTAKYGAWLQAVPCSARVPVGARLSDPLPAVSIIALHRVKV